MYIKMETAKQICEKLHPHTMATLLTSDYQKGTDSVLSNGMIICSVDALARMIKDLQDLKTAIEEATGTIIC